MKRNNGRRKRKEKEWGGGKVREKTRKMSHGETKQLKKKGFKRANSGARKKESGESKMEM